MSYPHTLSAVKVGALELRNRIMLAPMTRARAGPTRVPNDNMVKYFEQRSGAGILVTDASAIDRRGEGWVDSPSMYTKEHVEGWKKVVDAVHKKGSVIFLQLWFIGRAGHSSFMEGEHQILSASDVTIEGEGVHTADGGKKPYEQPRPVTTEEVEDIVQSYKRGAELAKEAGFDGVEVHGANGYLIDQFFQSKTNKRTDKYGGSMEKRCTFAFEILDEVCKVYPPSQVGFRISPNGAFNDMGSPEYRELFLHVATEIGKRKLAYLHVMIGLGFGFHNLGEPMTMREFRDVVPKETALIANVGFTPESTEEILASGDADLVAIGRPYIANPDYVERLRDGHPLAEDSDPSTWFSPDLPERAVYSTGAGYTDYPTYAEQKAE